MSALAMTTRPGADEFAPYYNTYVKLVPDGDILATLESQLGETIRLLGGLSESRANYRYAPDKWSIKEVVGHMTDTERVMAFRALWFARRDRNAQPSFEQDDWVRATNFGARQLGDLLAEFKHAREASVLMFRGFDEDTLFRRGTANGVEFTVRSLAYILAGHERHHVNLLRERYLTRQPLSPS